MEQDESIIEEKMYRPKGLRHCVYCNAMLESDDGLLCYKCRHEELWSDD